MERSGANKIESRCRQHVSASIRKRVSSSSGQGLVTCNRIEQMVLWYLDIHSRYTDMLGELMADQVAHEKQAGAGKCWAFLLSLDEDGEDELGVAQELDQDSDDDATMVE